MNAWRPVEYEKQFEPPQNEWLIRKRGSLLVFHWPGVFHWGAQWPIKGWCLSLLSVQQVGVCKMNG